MDVILVSLVFSECPSQDVLVAALLAALATSAAALVAL